MSYSSSRVQSNVGTDAWTFKNFIMGAGSLQCSDNAWASFFSKDTLPLDGTLSLSASPFGTFKIPSGLPTSTVFVIAWKGTVSAGGARFNGLGGTGCTILQGASFVSGSTGFFIDIQGTDGYIEFQLATSIPSTITLNFLVGCTYSGFTSLIWCRKTDYASLQNITDPGQVFTDEYVNVLSALNLKTIRTLGLAAINNQPQISRFDYRKNWKTGIFHGAKWWVPGAWAGTSAGTSPNFTLASGAPDTPAVITDGEVIQFMPHANASVGVASFGTRTGGTGYVDGVYNNVPMTSNGSGSGVTANFTVSGGVVTACTLVNSGGLVNGGTGGYRLSDVLGVNNANLGGTGSGFSMTIGSLTAPIAIDVKGRGSVPIYEQQGLPLTVLQTSDGPSTLIHDDLLGCYLYYQGGYGNGIGYMPIELCIGLANRLNAGLWVCVPHKTTMKNSTMEGGSNSMAQMAQLIDSTLNSGAAIFGLGNEIWNTNDPFWRQTNYFGNCGSQVGIPFTNSNNIRQFMGWHAYKTCQMADVIRSVWGGRNQLKISMEFQCFGDPTTTKNYKFSGIDLASVANGGQGNATWVSYTGDANFTTTGNKPADRIDIASYASYYSGHNCANFDANWTLAKFNIVKVWADLYATGTPANIDSAFQSLDADIAGPASDQTTEDLVAKYNAWEATVASLDSYRTSAGKAIIEIHGYEGDFEASALSTTRCTQLGVSTSYGGPGGLIDNLLTGYKNSKYFYLRGKKQLDQMIAASPSRTVSPSWFLVTGGTQWSMMTTVQGAKFLSYDAVMNYNTRRTRLYSTG